MPDPDRPRDPLARIATARHELGRTAVSPAVARGLVAGFIALTAAPLLAQLAVEPAFFLTALRSGAGGVAGAPGESVAARVFAGNRALLASIRAIDDLLGDESLATRVVRPPLQALLQAAGAGTAQVHQGVDGWLFYAPDVAHVTGPGFLEPRQLRRRAAEGDTVTAARRPDPRPAIHHLHRQLARRGVTLIVMPTPVKPAVDGRRLGGRAAARVAGNASHGAFVEHLRARGVPVFDVLGELRAARAGQPRPLYLATDTHWRPETVELVAGRLAAFIERRVVFADGPTTVRRTAAQPVTNRGDTARLLGPARPWTAYPPETVAVRRIVFDDARSRQSERPAEVLLLGDSFSNVFSLAAMGWGAAAGLAEQLAFALQRPVDRLARNDDGAYASRALLAAALRRGQDLLAGKRVVVFQFATRELSRGDWRLVDLRPSAPPPRPASFLRPAPGARLEVRGVVREIGPLPRPGSVPYPDHIAALHVAEVTVRGAAAAVDGDDLLVYLWSMRGHQPTGAARYRAGDAIALRIRPWSDVAGALDGINRSEVAAPAARLAEPWWGEPIGEPR